ncbi:MAG: folate-binding protein YgfZ [Gammaproteobacteria bacterium]|nr:folate-binding protein YgfZ [Gammaproteobacteria bacterium]
MNMTQQWHRYLESVGAEFDGTGCVIHFGNPEAERREAVRGCILSDLSCLGLIEVAGSDAEKFLQGQFTNDVRKVDAVRNQLSAWCTHKGRILVTFRLFKRDAAYYMLLPKDSLDAVLKRLQMYVLRSDVRLRDSSGDLPRIGLAGNDTLLQTCCAFKKGAEQNLPAEANRGLSMGQTTILRIPGPQARYIILSEAEALQNLWSCLAAQAVPAGAAAWELLDVLAGIPQIGAALAEAFIPQMINLHVLDGVSFKKGCYTGQEVVARTKSLGKVKRQMYLAHIDTDTCPLPSDTLYAGETEAGKVVNAQAHPDGGCLALAVVQIDAVEADGIRWQTQDGPLLHFMELPY